MPISSSGVKPRQIPAVGGLLRQQLLHRLEDDGDARLVVRPQQGGAVGADQILAHEFLQLGNWRPP